MLKLFSYIFLFQIICSISFAQIQFDSTLTEIENSFSQNKFKFSFVKNITSNSVENNFIEIKYPQKEFNPFYQKKNYYIISGIGALTLGAGIYIYQYQRQSFWADNRGPFQIINDWKYAKWIDKVGHFYGTHILSHAFASGFEAANLTSEQSVLYGALLGLASEIYFEIEDGYHKSYGFSPGDATFDFLGAAYFTAQYYFPYLKNFQLKWSYFPSKEFLNDKTGTRIIIDDYSGQKYWLSFRMKELLPKKAANYWPSFLNIAAGMGIKGFKEKDPVTKKAKEVYNEFYIAFDLDAEALPIHGKFGSFVKNSLNYFHLPMPGVRITPNAAFFVLSY